MASRKAKQPHRHYKTLIVLVASMTLGTLALYGMARLSPVTPLRSRTAARWNRVTIRAVVSDSPRGFFHFRIDDTGRLFQSRAWDAGQPDRAAPGTVQVLLTCERSDLRVSAEQAEMLSRFISHLQSELSIRPENVAVDTEPTPDGRATPRKHLRRT